MKGKLSWFCVVGMMMLGLVVGPATTLGVRAEPSEPAFSAATAATLIEQSGQIGQVFLSSLPAYCSQYSNPKGSGIYEQVYVIHPEDGRVGVTARPGVVQKVGIHLRLYQRLANGAYQLLDESPTEQTLLNAEDLPNAIAVNGRWDQLAAGPDYVLAYLVKWYAPDGQSLDGWAVALKSDFIVLVDDVVVDYDHTLCDSSFPTKAFSVSATTGTVNSLLKYSLDNYPLSVRVNALWDGKVIDTTQTTSFGQAEDSLLIPAAPMGPHKLSFTYGHWTATKTYTVKPRIKLIPSIADRGQTVNVSLRGFAKKEVVRIRWKKGTSWVELARVTTSSTGSANINVKVPTWAPYGSNSVRGDGTYGHAQTNAVSVLQPGFASVAQPTQTPTPSPTAIPATATPTPTSTPSPTVEVPTPAPTATPTVALTETATPEPAPEETAAPLPVTETPTPQPPAEATAEPSQG